MVKEVTTQSEIDKTNGKIICDFTATWCGPCKQIKPVFEKLEKEYSSLKFICVDVDKCPDIAKKYGVTAMPTFVVIQNSNSIDELKGASPNALRNLCDKHKGPSAFSGKGYVLGSTTPVSSTGTRILQQGTSFQPPATLKTIVLFLFPFLIYLAVSYIYSLIK
eukprot:NODE_5_length_72347_cov_1.339331.p48 type:complete len:163 gc:universal NODE_5_length_72347_cov_1.339331:45166-45654(+)